MAITCRKPGSERRGAKDALSDPGLPAECLASGGAVLPRPRVGTPGLVRRASLTCNCQFIDSITL
jgi:hypothetical protein